MLNCANSNFVFGLGPFATVLSVQGRTVNAGPCGQCRARAVRSMHGQGRTVNAGPGPYGQCKAKAVRSIQVQIRTNAEPHARCRAARTMQGHTLSAGPNSMQGREPNSGPQAWSASGLRRPCWAFNVGSDKKEEGAVRNKRGKRACLCHKFLLVLPLHSQRVALSLHS